MKMQKKDKNNEYKKFKREGILRLNKEEARKEKPDYHREKKAQKWKKVKLCGSCKGFIGTRGFSRHLNCCQPNSCKPSISIPASFLEVPSNLEIDEDFKNNILGKLRENEVGNLCRTDQTILKVGMMFYGKVKRKADKKVQVRKTVRVEMRRLGNLYLHLKTNQGSLVQIYNDASDMFLRQNFNLLRSAIDTYSSSESGKIKAGLKQNLLYLLKRAAKAIKAIKLTESKDDEAEQFDKFVEIFELLEDYIFGDAQYELNKRRQVNLRRPEKLPAEEDILCIRKHVITKMSEYDTFTLWDTLSFVELRDCCVSRLTLLNARRGGEPARLTIDEWQDAASDKWIDQQRIKDFDELDQLLIKSLKVTYITGKGNNHLVPLLIPEDTTSAIQKLCNKEIRMQSGVKDSNNYLFSSTKNSEDHVSGWHALNRVCKTLPLKDPGNVKATSNRHRISTLFAALDLSESDRDHFYRHMGHSKNINMQVYQAPLAIMAVTKIGKRLMEIDSGMQYFKFLIAPVMG